MPKCCKNYAGKPFCAECGKKLGGGLEMLLQHIRATESSLRIRAAAWRELPIKKPSDDVRWIAGVIKRAEKLEASAAKWLMWATELEKLLKERDAHLPA